MIARRYDTVYLDDNDPEVTAAGRYVLYTDYTSLEDRCMSLEYALLEISRLPDCDSYMCRQIARDALSDTSITNGD